METGLGSGLTVRLRTEHETRGEFVHSSLINKAQASENMTFPFLFFLIMWWVAVFSNASRCAPLKAGLLTREGVAVR